MPVEPEDHEVLDGPIEGLSGAEMQRFARGDEAFSEAFTVATGLGPRFVSTSCISCHAGDGKGHPFSTLVRFGQGDTSGNKFLHLGGPQLQNRAIPGHSPEVLPAGAPHSRFIPPSVAGIGLLEAIPDQTLLDLADPDDATGNGISGRINWVDVPGFIDPPAGAETRNGRYIGRFGHKAAIFNLLQQTVTAYLEDIGITSIHAPTDPYIGMVQEPEVSLQTINDVVFYLQTLKPPTPRNQDDPEVQAGKMLFSEIGCASCHIPELQTGPSPIQALAYQTIFPFTDLLLHDMGPELDDGYTEGTALTSEWRTMPLWGLGLAPDSQGGAYFLMHDGRARSIEEAIELHGGEAANSREKLRNLPPDKQQQLIRFLESL